MKELKTIYPYGLNERVDGIGNVSHQRINIESLSRPRKRRKRSHGHRKNNRNKYNGLKLFDVLATYNDNNPMSLHRILTKLYSLPHKVLDRISSELAGIKYSHRREQYPDYVLKIVDDVICRKLITLDVPCNA